jgi:hypothetical protein
VAYAHRSRALPERPHLKHWKVLSWRLAEKQRLVPAAYGEKTAPTRKHVSQLHLRARHLAGIWPIDTALPRGDAGMVASLLVGPS